MVISMILITLIDIQFATGRGSLDIDDFILNILGVYLGVVLYPVCQKVIQVR